jgi:hypothetical protein
MTVSCYERLREPGRRKTGLESIESKGLAWVTACTAGSKVAEAEAEAVPPRTNLPRKDYRYTTGAFRVQERELQ